MPDYAGTAEQLRPESTAGSVTHASSLEAINFRNVKSLSLGLSAGVTVFYGPNGAGKSSLLEAVYTSLVGSSCRSANLRDVIALGEDFFRTRTTVDSPLHRGVFEVSVARDGEKLVKVDGSRVDQFGPEPARPLVGVFNPDRLELIKGAPGARRAHVDRLIEAFWPSKAQLRRDYVGSLMQRNALLSSGQIDELELRTWTTETARQGLELTAARSAVVDQLTPALESKAQALGLAQVDLSYVPSIKVEDRDELVELMLSRLGQERVRGFTTIGPHRDEFRFSLTGKDLRRFGSQGEQRAAVLALLLAERELLTAARSSGFLLLLDDVLSELDGSRRQSLMAELSHQGQCLISTADRAEVAGLEGDATVASITELMSAHSETT